MTNYCVDCGSPIPAEQRICSMCYGDINFGRDDYYKEWAEEQKREEERELDDGKRYNYQ